MKKTAIFALIVLMLLSFVSGVAEGPNVYEPGYVVDTDSIDVSELTGTRLNGALFEISDVIWRYYDRTSEERSTAIEKTKEYVNSYLAGKNTSGSWPWFDYDVKRIRDTFEVQTHVTYTSNNEKKKFQVYAELSFVDDAWKVYFMKIGGETIVDERDTIPENRWLHEPKPEISNYLGINLTDYSESELNKLAQRIADEYNANHYASSAERSEVIRLTKVEVEGRLEGAHSFSWPWINYDVSKDWDLLIVESTVKYRDDAGKHETDVISQAYPKGDLYELFYLKVGNQVLIDRRYELPRNLWIAAGVVAGTPEYEKYKAEDEGGESDGHVGDTVTNPDAADEEWECAECGTMAKGNFCYNCGNAKA